MSGFTIGQIAEDLGLSARTIRFWEEKGLVNPRHLNGQRSFDEKDRAEIARIIQLTEAGLSLREVATVQKMKAAMANRFLMERLDKLQREMDLRYASQSRAIRSIRSEIAVIDLDQVSRS